jgi:type IV secretory pathway VirB6-like protein
MNLIIYFINKTLNESFKFARLLAKEIINIVFTLLFNLKCISVSYFNSGSLITLDLGKYKFYGLIVHSKYYINNQRCFPPLLPSL